MLHCFTPPLFCILNPNNVHVPFLFLVPPVIVKSPSSTFTVRQINSEVKLVCSARGSPLPNVEWTKDGNPVSTNITVRKNDIETTGELTVPSFEPEHQGKYVCFFKNYDNGTAEKAIRVG
jgi:hypothetical protein